MATALTSRCARQLIARKSKSQLHPAFARFSTATATAPATASTSTSTTSSNAPATPARVPYRANPSPASPTTPTTTPTTTATPSYTPPSFNNTSAFGGGNSYSFPGGSAPVQSPGAPRAAEAFKNGLNDSPAVDVGAEGGIDWARSFSGLSAEAFPENIRSILMAPLDPNSIEVKPDGILYLPEIKYRRILNQAFGPGGWGLAPRSDTIVTDHSVTREYGLICHNRLVSVARGEQHYFDASGIPTATEGCKSNALMRTCKDLGIASELWDPRFIKKFKKEHCVEIMTEHVVNKKRKKLWFRKGDSVEYPFKAI